MEGETKQRIIQEYVPGKQVTLAHIIANPDEDIYKKLGLVVDKRESLGILTITPSEAAIIAADVATKASDISLGFIDRFSRFISNIRRCKFSRICNKNILKVLGDMLGFSLQKLRGLNHEEYNFYGEDWLWKDYIMPKTR